VRAAFRVGLLGYGNVGRAFARRVSTDASQLESAAGRPILLEAIGVPRDLNRTAPAPVTNSDAVVERKDLDAVVELIGGVDPAHRYIDAALRSGRQVITANKQLIAAEGPALARLGPLRFEAAVGSAIPIVEVMAETLGADRISSVTGILNGTTNVMLQRMGEGVSYDAALKEAQEGGMAEADPSADVDAHDPAAKLAILIMLAFRHRVALPDLARSGIRALTTRQIEQATQKHCVIKLIAAAIQDGLALRADVRPRLVPADHVLARANGPLNAVSVVSRYAGELTLIGPGAGPDAAASAVVADVIRAARDMPASAGELLSTIADQKPVTIAPLGATSSFPAAE
jgi:homoserine dehydrogenase